MDGAKILPAIIVAGCIGWFIYEKQFGPVSAEGEESLTLSGAIDCAAVEAKEQQIGGEAPTEIERLTQACRLHVCGHSFMHGSTVNFVESTPQLVAVDTDKMLTDGFTAVSEVSKTRYEYRCYVAADELKKPGRPYVKSASFVQQ